METDRSYPDLVHSCRGILFFGVPNQGLAVEQLRRMVKGQLNTLLQFAVRERNDDIASLLMQHGAKLNVHDDAITPLQLVRNSGSFKAENAARLLVGLGLGGDSRDTNRTIPEGLAAGDDPEHIVRFVADCEATMGTDTVKAERIE